MSNFSHYTLQQSVYQRLSTDSTLLAMMSAVYDRPPQGSAFPYITLGEAAITDFSTKTSTGTEQILTLHIWSRGGGRKESALIMERVYALLHQASLSVTGQALVLMRFLSSEILLENDGCTYHGIMRFRAVLESI
jgi:hypothetical protein